MARKKKSDAPACDCCGGADNLGKRDSFVIHGRKFTACRFCFDRRAEPIGIIRESHKDRSWLNLDPSIVDGITICVDRRYYKAAEGIKIYNGMLKLRRARKAAKALKARGAASGSTTDMVSPLGDARTTFASVLARYEAGSKLPPGSDDYDDRPPPLRTLIPIQEGSPKSVGIFRRFFQFFRSSKMVASNP